MTTTTRRQFTAYTSQANAQAQRKRELGHIHQGKAALAWSDDDYRFHLRNLTGKTSASELDAAGRAAVLAHMYFTRCGAKTETTNAWDECRSVQSGKTTRTVCTPHSTVITQEPK